MPPLNSTSADSPHYISLQEASDLGYGSYQTLRNYIAAGKLSAVKIGGRVKVSYANLDALAVPIAPSANPFSGDR